MIDSWIINYRCSNCGNDKFKENLTKTEKGEINFLPSFIWFKYLHDSGFKSNYKKNKLAIQFIDLFIIWFIAIWGMLRAN